MMMMACVSLSLGLIALSFGVAMLIWGYRNQGKCVGCARVFGYIITIGSILILCCCLFKCLSGHRMGCHKMGPRGAHMMQMQRSQP